MSPLFCTLILAATLSPPGPHASPAAVRAQAAPRILLDQSPRAIDYQISRLSNDELLRLERKQDDVKYRPIYVALLTRQGLPQPARDEALAVLMAMDGTSAAQVLLEGLAKIPEDDRQTGDRLMEMLLSRPPAELEAQRAVLQKATGGDNPSPVIAAAYGALMVAADDPAPAWQAASADHRLTELLRSVPHLGRAGALPQRLVPSLAAFLDGTSDPAARAAAVEALGATGRDTATFERLAREILKPPAGPDQGARAAAIAALLRIPESAWQPDRVAPLARAIVSLVKESAPEARTEPALVEAVQLGEKLAAALPDDTRRSLRRELRALGVRVVPIATIPEQLLFDLKWFAAEAGRPVQIVLTNPDAMPHNLVVGAPRSVQEIGTAASAMPPPANPEARAYVPDSPLVLHATRLLQAGEIERLNFTAPAKPGEYVFLCTFPGHWIRMYGVMLVVPDLDARQANPTKPTDPLTNKPYEAPRN